MSRVFINKRLLRLLEHSDLRSVRLSENILNYSISKSIIEAYKRVEGGEIKHLDLIANDVENLYEAFKDQFIFIEAAGGIITNAKDEVLAILRKQKWDLPKGKIDDGERPIEAAKREIEEECGLRNFNIEDFLCHTYHMYKNPYGEGIVLKKTWWFFGKTAGANHLKPQLEEGIESALFLPIEDLEERLKHSYKPLIDVLNAYRYYLYRSRV